MRNSLQELLAAGAPVIADGAMGTMLFAAGLAPGEAPEVWNVTHSDTVRQVHRAYIEAGAQIILTNTLGGTRIALGAHTLDDRAVELNTAAARLARAEADAADHPVVVGGSMGSTGQILAPLGTLPFEDAVAAFEEQARALVDGGADVLWIETMADLEEVRAALEGIRRAVPEAPVVVTMTFDTRGRTMMGTTPEQALAMLSSFDLLAVGANCGKGPDELENTIEKMSAVGSGIPLVAKANAGLPRMEAGRTVYNAPPDVMAAYAVRVRDRGAQIIGACCGSTPDHIRAIAGALKQD